MRREGKVTETIVPSDNCFVCCCLKYFLMTLRVGKPDDKKEKGGDKADDKVKYQYYPLWVCFTSE